MIDRRDAREIGRRARLDLVFAVRRGRTELVHQYVEPPFRIGRIFPENGGGVHVIMASSAPGIFGGDTFETTVLVEEGARVRLTSQSSLQIHPAADGATATVTNAYRVEAGGSLSCEWDPVIPFPEAVLQQRNAIDLAADATLYWGDAMMSGREARGERWRFTALAHELQIKRQGQLVYLERYALEPRTDAISARWLAETACYFGTVVVSNPIVTRRAAERVHEKLCAIDGLSAAADLVDESLLLARLMATSGPVFHRARSCCHLAVDLTDADGEDG
jgi:urease accessory protein